MQDTKRNHWVTLILVTILTAVLSLTFISPVSAGGDDKKGKDNTSQGDKTQGKSDSNPDGGGKDKPGCAQDSAGCQGKTDRDGNNGCGNDGDREDDNNGKCGGKHEKPSKTTTTQKSHPTTTEKPKNTTTTHKPHPTTTEKPHTTTTKKDHPTTTEKPHTTTTQKDHPTTTEKPHGPTTTAKPNSSVPTVTMPVLEKKQPVRMGSSATTRHEAPIVADRQFARTGLNLFEWLVIGVVILGIGILLTRRMR